VKTDVEELSPTRVRLTIEVPFDELKKTLDHAYREVARQVRIPGFRPGKVPPRIIDQRIGRSAVLEHAVSDAVPEFYGQAVRETEVVPLGQPDVEITRLDDGAELAFTAEVDVRPRFELPDLATIAVTVQDAEVTPDHVEEYLAALRERFASLRSVDRAAGAGDYVSVDLSASIDGTPVEDAQASGVSYEVGSGSMLDGLDDALAGLSAGESATFRAELAGGEHAGETADVTVTVNSVKVKELPELDDEFAQLASEFDTLGELRAGTRRQLEALRRAGQQGQARERALDALMALVDMPLPDALVQQEIEMRRRSLADQAERAGTDIESYLAANDTTAEQVEREFAEDARRAVKAGFILDKLAAEENLTVDASELSGYVTEQAYRMGVAPDRLARDLSERGQLGSVAADVLRSKALTLLAERADVTDESGRKVNMGSAPAGPAAEDEDSAEDGPAGSPSHPAGQSATEAAADPAP
jgi:trigger factor